MSLQRHIHRVWISHRVKRWLAAKPKPRHRIGNVDLEYVSYKICLYQALRSEIGVTAIKHAAKHDKLDKFVAENYPRLRCLPLGQQCLAVEAYIYHAAKQRRKEQAHGS